MKTYWSVQVLPVRLSIFNFITLRFYDSFVNFLLRVYSHILMAVRLEISCINLCLDICIRSDSINFKLAFLLQKFITLIELIGYANLNGYLTNYADYPVLLF
jgi:hypothetical protein